MNQKFTKDYYRMTGKTWHGSLRDCLDIVLHHNLQYMYLFRKYETHPSWPVHALLHRLTKKFGRENRGKRAGVPVIGDNVWVGINAVVVGSITIGDDVLIAPGSFVNRNIPSHCVVIGNPCTVHPNDHAAQGYVNYAVSYSER